jgi:hypothetical protein
MSEPGGDPSPGISSGDGMIPTERHPAYRRREDQSGSRTERENLGSDGKGQATSGSNREGDSTDAEHRDGAARSSVEGSVMGLERRGCIVQPKSQANWNREEPASAAKPFSIPKREVWDAGRTFRFPEAHRDIDSIADEIAQRVANHPHRRIGAEKGRYMRGKEPSRQRGEINLIVSLVSANFGGLVDVESCSIR